MNYNLVQTDLFGNVVPSNNNLKFCLKMHYAEKAGLHYDLRLQVPDVRGNNNESDIAKSFSIKNGPSLNPHHKPLATMMDDHKVSAFRREGTILRGTGIGSVLHFDEGFFTIPNCQSSKEIYDAFHKGIENGRLTVFFTGYKMKGEFHFYRKTTGKFSQWIIQKANDEFATDFNILTKNQSILTGYTLQYYTDLFYKQKQILKKLPTNDIMGFLRKNDDWSFRFKKALMPKLDFGSYKTAA